MTFCLILDKIEKIRVLISMVSKKTLHKRIFFTILTVFSVCFIFSQSLMNGSKSGSESGRFLAFLNSITDFLGFGEIFTHSFVRKCAHFTEFAVLSFSAFFMYKSYLHSRVKTVIFTIVTFVSVAVTDEIIQYFVPERACQFTDVLIDSLGGIVAVVLSVIIITFSAKKHKA